MSAVSHLLNAIDRGDPHAADQLLPLVYDELRRLAAQCLAREHSDQAPQATSLVHEAYLRLVGDGGENRHWDHRGHFFAAAAQAMRRILVDAARRRGRQKHGGGRHRVDLEAAPLVAPAPRDDLAALDDALTRLAAEDPQAARLVELRHFAGLSVADAAQLLGVSPRTADRTWAYARAWLHRELTGGRAGQES